MFNKNTNWINDFCEKIEKVDTEGKIITCTYLYYVYLYKRYYDEVCNASGKIYENGPEINNVEIESDDIYIVTTQKGNFYGLKREVVKNKPGYAQYFRNAVPGTSGFVWTNSIKNVNDFLVQFSKNEKIDIEYDSELEFGHYGYYTSYENAKHISDIITKLHDTSVTIRWHNEKINKYQEDIEYFENVIKGCYAEIDRWQKEIEFIKNEIEDQKKAIEKLSK